ncbi:MAG: proton-conducting transporter membrane subunit [Elusimicrobiota bacterium]|nr:proton-conducting transporter membrane subunit [Elusimicrobiota bacterium]
MGEGRLFAVVLAPLAAAALSLLLRRVPLGPPAVSVLAAAIQFSILLSLLPGTLSGLPAETAALPLAAGASLRLRADALGLLFALVSSGLWAVTAVYAAGYLGATGEKRLGAFYAYLGVCLSAAAGIALSAGPLSFLVFYEILTLATYPLVVFTGKPAAVAAGRKYLVYALGAGQLLLVATVWALWLAPGAEFTPGGFLAGRASPAALSALFFLFAAAFAVKAAVMPLHGWLPSAMAAPVPVSALLHAVAVVKAGAFGFLRLTGFVFGPALTGELGAGRVLAWAAAATIVIASLRALGETNLKRRLAYSTIGQLSYIVLGAALGSTAAFAAAAFHIAAHGLMKITLFFCAGGLYAHAHVEDVSEMNGIGRRMPLTMGAFALAALGLAGMPALAGFLVKWNLGWGAADAGRPLFIAVLIVSAVLNFAYFFPIVHSAFFGKGGGNLRLEEPSAALWGPPVLTALGALAVGLFPDAGASLYRLAWAAARACAGGAP